MRVGWLVSAVAAICAWPREAQASAEDVFGYGVRSSAMGAVGAAVSKGYESVYGNPALLAGKDQKRELTLGYLGAHFDLRAGADGEKRLPYDGLFGAYIGALLPIPFGGFLKERVTLGLAFFTPFDLIVRGRILYPEKPQFLVADRTQTVAVQAAVGLDIGHGIRIGGGFAALAALTGSVLVATDASGRVGTVVEDTLVASYGPLIGASYDVNEQIRVGLTFRGTLVGHFNVVINVQDLGGVVVPPLNISGVAQYDPWQIALEGGWFKGAWTLAAGLTLKHWSAYPGPPEATVRCPEGNDPLTGMPFEGACTAPSPEPPNFSDTVVPHLGVERTIPFRPGVAGHLRGGYFFEPSPAPEQKGASNLFDNARSAFSLGYGVELSAPLPSLRVDCFGQFHLLHPETHTKDPSVSPENPGAPSVKARGLIAAGGATLTVGF